MTKYAVITGASSGIGLEFTKLLAADGYDMLIAARDGKALRKLSKELATEYKTKATPLAVDLSIPGAAEKLWKKLGTQKVDVFINNAGFGDYVDVVKSDPVRLERMIALNITALTQLSRLAAIAMKKRRRGSIVNVGSILSFVPSPHNAVYGATKAYVLSFSEALGEELKGTGVSVTALCPGPTRTGFAAAARMEKSAVMQSSRLPTGKEVAIFGYEAMKQKKVVAVHGAQTKFVALIGARFLPRSAIRRIIERVQRRDP
jgi:uncharacterized protein